MKGTMSERGVGVWRLRVVTRYTLDGKPVQRSKTVKGTRRQAQTELARFVAEAEADTVAASGGITFGRYLTEQYLPQVKDNLSPETYRNHSSRVNLRIIPELGHVQLAKLTALPPRPGLPEMAAGRPGRFHGACPPPSRQLGAHSGVQVGPHPAIGSAASHSADGRAT